MSLIKLLKIQWEWLGLNAPWFSWVASIGLLTYPIYYFVKLYIHFRKESRVYFSALKQIESLQNQYMVKHGNGLTVAQFDAVAQMFDKHPSLSTAWNAYKLQIVRHQRKNREEQLEDEYWSTDSAESAFSEAELIDAQLNRSFFVSIPGVVTGTGLLFTFLAILIALFDVKINPATKRFDGIPELIGGLSGKFVSSVAALFSATIFLICEKPVFHRLNLDRKKLVTAIDSFIPRLTPTQVLSDIHHDIAEQTNAFRLFNSDLSLILKQSFNESMGPTLERMVTTIEKLENQKQDSIKSELEELLKSLEQSLKTTLGTMGDSFKESLSGSAKDQFDQIVKTLQETAMLLENMNTQSSQTQTDLQALINMARNSTVEQIALGKSQVEVLTNVLRELMTQLRETANTSVNDMTLKLTFVTQNLSEKITQLGEQMAGVMQKTSDDTTKAANDVVQKAGDWSNKSSAQLDQLIEKYQSQLELTSDLKNELNTTLLRFNDSIGKYGQVTTDLKQVTGDVNITVSLMTQASENIKQTNESLKTIAGFTRDQIQGMQEANKDQRELGDQIHHSMEQYGKTFQQVENSAKALLNEITEQLKNYYKLTEDNFKELVKVSNDHLSSAVSGLADSVADLNDLLNELHAKLNKVK